MIAIFEFLKKKPERKKQEEQGWGSAPEWKSANQTQPGDAFAPNRPGFEPSGQPRAGGFYQEQHSPGQLGAPLQGWQSPGQARQEAFYSQPAFGQAPQSAFSQNLQATGQPRQGGFSQGWNTPAQSRQGVSSQNQQAAGHGGSYLNRNPAGQPQQSGSSQSWQAAGQPWRHGPYLIQNTTGHRQGVPAQDLQTPAQSWQGVFSQNQQASGQYGSYLNQNPAGQPQQGATPQWRQALGQLWQGVPSQGRQVPGQGASCLNQSASSQSGQSGPSQEQSPGQQGGGIPKQQGPARQDASAQNRQTSGQDALPQGGQAAGREPQNTSSQDSQPPSQNRQASGGKNQYSPASGQEQGKGSSSAQEQGQNTSSGQGQGQQSPSSVQGQGQDSASGQGQQGQSQAQGQGRNDTIPCSIKELESRVKATFKNSSDMVITTIKTVCGEALIVFVDGMTDKDLIDRDIVKPLRSPLFDGDVSGAISSVYTVTEKYSKAIDDVLDGNVAVYYEGAGKAWLVEFKHWMQRSVEEPSAESVIRGPKEGFTENIRTNTALIRRKLKTPNLVFEAMTLGRVTNTDVCIAYIDGIVNTRILAELRRRLSRINTDAILETGYIEQYIEENTYSPVSGIGMTQKPDVVAGRLLEGRVAILCDGSPHVLTIPELFIENIQTSEDYYNRFLYASILRLLRILGLFITVVVPGLYVAIVTFNQEMLPSVFLRSIITSTLKTPMPVSAEIFVLTLMFELLKEAGTRLPKAIGSAITIVGSLIIGEAAVSAGIVSEASVIIVALSAVASFIVPNLSEFTLIYRALFWIFGSAMGIIGIASCAFIMAAQLISTTSFGIPILSSFSLSEMNDSFVRAPLKKLRRRPETIIEHNNERMGNKP